MKQASARILSVLLLALSPALLPAQTPVEAGKSKSTAKAPAAALPIGVVNVQIARRATKAYQNYEQELKKRSTYYNKELDRRQDAVKALREEIISLEPSPDKTRAIIAYEAEKRGLEVSRKQYQEELNRLQLSVQPQVFAELDAAIAELAKARGLVLVLRKTEVPSIGELVKSGMKEENARRLVLEDLSRRSLLYSSDAVDITQAVVQLLKK